MQSMQEQSDACGNGAPEVGKLQHDQYVVVMRKISKALLEAWDSDEATAIAGGEECVLPFGPSRDTLRTTDTGPGCHLEALERATHCCGLLRIIGSRVVGSFRARAWMR